MNALLDCAPSLDAWAAEAQSGAAFTRRTGNEQVAHWLDRYLWLAGVLHGDGPSPTKAPPTTGTTATR